MRTLEILISDSLEQQLHRWNELTVLMKTEPVEHMHEWLQLNDIVGSALVMLASAELKHNG